MGDWKIQTKLLAAFGLVMAIVAGYSVFSISRLSSLNTVSAVISSRRMPTLVTVNKLDTATSDYEVYQRDEILDVDAVKIASDRRARLDRGRFVDAKVAELDASLGEPEARALLQQFKTSWAQYVQASEQVAKLADVNRNAEALALLRASQKLYDGAEDNLTRLIDLQQKLADQAEKQSLHTYQMSRALSFAALGLVGALMVAILVLLVRTIARPLTRMTGAMAELGAGNVDVDIPVEVRRDEVGELAGAMARFRDQLAAAERAKSEQTEIIVSSIGKGLADLADGDLIAEVEADLAGPFAPLKRNFNDAVEALRSTMNEVARAAGGIHSGAGEVRAASDDLSQRTERQAASLEETAAAMEEITNTVKGTAKDAQRADQIVRDARREANESGEVVRQAVDAMGGIERTSAEISEIISVIDGIAFQTNLLALNAGVEAARAGDAGAGFAVVASEVRSLAQRAAESAKDVKARVLASSEQVDLGVALVNQTGSALERIIGRIGEISELVGNIATAAEQQAAGLQQVNIAVTEMDGVTQQNAAMVEEATAAARNLAAEADELARQVGRFKVSRNGDDEPSVSIRPSARAAISALRAAA